MGIKHLLFAAIVGVLVYRALNLADSLGYFQRTFNQSPGQCGVLRSIEHGSEDIEALPSGLAFISSGYWLPARSVKENENIPGRIYLFDIKQPSAPAQEIKIVADKSYKLASPVGLNIWTDPKKKIVYVYITSSQPVNSVDKFRFDEGKRTLTHIRRITDPNFTQLDDLYVVGEDQFYFTNYFYKSLPAEIAIGLNWGSFGFYNETASTVIDQSLSIPCGIAESLNKKFIFVAQGGKGNIRVYEKGAQNSLTFSHAITVNTGVDGLFIDKKTGDLWFASHPSLYRTLMYVYGKSSVSPSQVMRIKLDAEGRAVKIDQIYSNDGTEFSASSAITVHGGRLLVGSVASNILICEIK